MSTTLTHRTWIDLTLLALLWSGSFLAIRTALDEIGPLASASHRVLWAALFLWIVALAHGLRPPKDIKLWLGFLVMGCLNNVIPFTLLGWGQLHIETGLTAILNAATAIWGVLVAALVFSDERLTLQRTVGVILGFFGVAVAVGLSNFSQLDLRSLAQLAVIGATLSYAFAGSWARAVLHSQAPLLSAACMLSCSTVVLLGLTTVFEGPLPLSLEPRTWGAIAYYSMGATAFAYLLYYRILRQTGAGNLLLVTLMLPPIAILLGAWARDEALSSTAYLGFGILALGLLIIDGRLFSRLMRR